jgi:hypothetical protein
LVTELPLGGQKAVPEVIAGIGAAAMVRPDILNKGHDQNSAVCRAGASLHSANKSKVMARTGSNLLSKSFALHTRPQFFLRAD